MRTHKLTCFAGAVAVIGVLAAAAPALAAPVPSSAATLSSTVVSPVTQARWWGPRWRGRYWRGPRWYWRGPVAGAVIGGVIVSRAYRGPVYYGPPGGPGYNNWLAYCSARYRSFDPVTGTFMGYDGRRHPCR